MKMASGTWPVLWQCSIPGLVLLVISERHLCWAKVTPAVWPSSGPWKLDFISLFAKVSILEQIGPGNLSSPCFYHHQPSPIWILRSKNRPVYIVSSSPWAKVKRFALIASENTGLAWELTELSYYTAPMFQIQLLLILFYETFWKKRWNSSMGGAGHLFQALYLATFLSIHSPPLQRERNIDLPVKHLTSYTLSVSYWEIIINVKSYKQRNKIKYTIWKETFRLMLMELNK